MLGITGIAWNVSPDLAYNRGFAECKGARNMIEAIQGSQFGNVNQVIHLVKRPKSCDIQNLAMRRDATEEKFQLATLHRHSSILDIYEELEYSNTQA